MSLPPKAENERGKEMNRKDAIDTERMLDRLTDVLASHSPETVKIHGRAFVADYTLVARTDAEALRRISMTLHRWYELECNGEVEVDAFGKAYAHSPTGRRAYQMHNREAGALKRLAKIMARYPALQFYVQSDPRGAALYILRPGDVFQGQLPADCYSRGLAVHK